MLALRTCGVRVISDPGDFAELHNYVDLNIFLLFPLIYREGHLVAYLG